MFARIVPLLGFLMIATVGCGPATPPRNANTGSTEPPVNIAATVAAVVASRSDETMATEPPDAGSTAVSATPVLAPVAATLVSPNATAVPSVPAIATAVPDAAPPTAVPPNAITVIPSATANELTGNLRMSFTHTIPEYIDWARGSFLYIEDQICTSKIRNSVKQRGGLELWPSKPGIFMAND